MTDAVWVMLQLLLVLMLLWLLQSICDSEDRHAALLAVVYGHCNSARAIYDVKGKRSVLMR